MKRFFQKGAAATWAWTHPASKLGLPFRSVRRFWRRKSALQPLRLEFQADALEIEESPMPWVARGILYAIVLLVVTTIVWMSLVSVDRIVVAKGTLVTTAAKIIVQPLETSIIHSIHVRVGQIVEKGDVLVSLDPTFASADENSARSQFVNSSAEVRRIEAELADAPPQRFSDDPIEQANQAAIFERRHHERETMLRSFDEEIKELEAKDGSLRADKIGVANEQIIAQKLESMRQKLYDEGNGSLVNLLEAQHQVAANTRETDRLSHEIVENAQKIATLRAKRDANLSSALAKADQELEAARKDLAKASQQIKKQERISTLIALRAPAKAMVLSLGSGSVGSVIREGEPIVTLVPLDVPLQIDADADPRDISQLRGGDMVRIKVDALPYQKYGTLDGTITAINGDVVDEDVEGHKVKVYKARVEITRNGLREVPPDFSLIPGMSTLCEIKVGKRRLITYFIYPIIRTLDSALREP
jgi:HlyD family secretion protein